jgi:hypothetical protein
LHLARWFVVGGAGSEALEPGFLPTSVSAFPLVAGRSGSSVTDVGNLQPLL